MTKAGAGDGKTPLGYYEMAIAELKTGHFTRTYREVVVQVLKRDRP